MKQVLYLQFRDDISKDHEYDCFVSKSGLTKDKFLVVNTILDKNVFDLNTLFSKVGAVIMGGSGQYDLSKRPHQLEEAKHKFSNIINYILENDIPTLGVCMGHQLISQFLGCEVNAVKEKSENGLVEVRLTSDGFNDPIYSTLPEKFKVTQAHKDCVISLPNDACLLLTNTQCPIQGYRYKKNIYTVQFHPELSPKDIIFRWGLYPEYLASKTTSEVAKLKADLEETPYAELIIEKFIKRYISK